MNRISFILAAIGFAAVLFGCKGGEEKTPEQGGQTTSSDKPPTDGLKELIKEDVKVGKGTRFHPNVKPIAAGDLVWVVYTGKFKDGKVFDTNDPKQKEGAKPFAFTVGVGQVIKGWDEGIVGMLPGGERKLSVPFALGYNERELPNIPKYTDLYFDVKVLDYVKAGEERTYGVYDQKKGTGKTVTENSVVHLHTVISDCAGNLIEDSRKAGDAIKVTLGKEETFPVIEDGLLGMKAGGIRELAVPPILGFRTDPGSGMDAQTLFYVTLILEKVE
jgi:FKBP-type peptidyl-prolyl cis-trans isomerase